MTPIMATNPLTTPATTEKTYDKWWILEINYSGRDAPMTSISISLKKFRTADDGIGIDFAPEGPVTFSVSDLMVKAQTDTKLAILLAALFDYVETEGKAQGVL